MNPIGVVYKRWQAGTLNPIGVVYKRWQAGTLNPSTHLKGVINRSCVSGIQRWISVVRQWYQIGVVNRARL